MSDVLPLATQAISAAKWSYAGNIARTASQFVVGIILARILGPSAFGTVAIAWLMISAGKLVADFGLGAALVQRQDLGPRDIQFAFTIQVLLGCGLMLIGVASAPLIATYFRLPAIESVIRVMSLLFVAQAIGQTSTSLLSRELRFKSIQIANVATYLLGYLGTGLPLALLGFGVWSLVVAQIVQTATYAAIVVCFSGMKLRFALHPDSPGMLRFGVKVIGANVASWALLNLDSAIAGRVIGVADLGLYNRSMTLVSAPTAAVTTSMQSVLFSACSRAQGNMERIRRAYLGVTGLLALLTLPLFVTVALVPETIVSAIYGAAWLDAADTLTPLALAMPVYAILALIGPVLMAVNKVEMEVHAQWTALLIAIPLLVVAAFHSLAALSWVVFFTYVLRLGLLAFAMQRVTGFHWCEWGKALLPGAAFALIVALPTFLADIAADLNNPWARLSVDMVIAGALSVVALRVLGPCVFQGPLSFVLKASQTLPMIVRRWARIA